MATTEAVKQRTLLGECSAEFAGTFILILFGVGVVAQVVAGGIGNHDSIAWAWGIGVIMGVYVSARLSGGHINPAVTIALAVFRGFAWRKVLPYCIAQLAGALAASAVVYLTYHEALDHFDGGVRHVTGDLATAGIWATYPQDFLSTFPGGFVDQVVGTALLMMIIFAVGDNRNMALPQPLGPIVVGLGVLVIGMTYGLNSGYAINPARDFGPRLFTYLAGWGKEVFTAGDHWWWVPIVAPCCGAVLGGWIYDLLITKQHDKLG